MAFYSSKLLPVVQGMPVCKLLLPWLYKQFLYVMLTPLKQVPPGTSAQKAELYAITSACNLAEGQFATIYTELRDALGVAQGPKQCGRIKVLVSQLWLVA